MKDYKKLWESHFGPIPFDDLGRRFHIHHKDGVKSNNAIENLMCISAQAHYDIHYAQGDYFACQLIARNHLNLDKNELIRIAELSGKLHKDTATVKDKNGLRLRVSINDPRYISGELVGTTKGFVSAKYVETGEYVYLTKEEFNQGNAAGIVVGTTSGLTITQSHKDSISRKLSGRKSTNEQKANYKAGSTGRKKIFNKSTNKCSWAYPIRKYKHQIVFSDITSLSEWQYAKTI